MIESRNRLGGIIHTYQKYNPPDFPSPTRRRPIWSPAAFEHMLAFGSIRELTEEELARAMHLDPSQIAGLGPSLESLMEMLRERKTEDSGDLRDRQGASTTPPTPFTISAQDESAGRLAERFRRAVHQEQLYDLERVWYQRRRRAQPVRPAVGAAHGPAGREISGRRAGRQVRVHRPHAADRAPGPGRSRKSWKTIDRLLKQLEEAAKTAQIGVIDMEELAEFAEPGDIEKLNELARQIEEYIRELAEQQGLEKSARRLPAHAQGLSHLPGPAAGADLQRAGSLADRPASGTVVGEGAVELQQTKPYEFGDSVANMDIPGSFINALVRQGPGPAGRHQAGRHRHPPHAQHAQVRHGGAVGHGGLDALRRAIYRRQTDGAGPGRADPPRISGRLSAVHRDVHASPSRGQSGEIAALMPKPVTIFDPVVRLRADMSDPNISECRFRPTSPTSSTACSWRRQFLATQDTPNRQVILITDGLPTAHFEGTILYLLYPPDPRTEEATCAKGSSASARGSPSTSSCSQLVAIPRGRAVRLPAGRIDHRPGVLRRRQGPRPLRGLGLRQAAAGDRGVRTEC